VPFRGIVVLSRESYTLIWKIKKAPSPNRDETLLAVPPCLLKNSKPLFSGTGHSDTLASNNGGIRRGLLGIRSTCCSQVYFNKHAYRVTPTPGSLIIAQPIYLSRSSHLYMLLPMNISHNKISVNSLIYSNVFLLANCSSA